MSDNRSASSPEPSIATDTRSYDLDEKAGRDIRALLSRTVVTQGLRIGRTLIILPLISPADLGVYKYVTVILAYLAHLHLGTFTVYNLHYPALDASGQRESADALQRLAWQGALLGSLVSFPILVLVLADLAKWEWPTIVLFSGLGALGLWSRYVTITYTVTQRFRERARIDATTSLAGFALALGGALAFGLTGFLFATILVPCMNIVLSHHARMPPIKYPLEAALFLRTFKTGARLWWSNVLSAARIGLDVVILKHVLPSAAGFGLYAFASVIATTIGVLGNSIVQVQSIHLARVVGRAGDVHSAAVWSQMERSILRDHVAMLLIVGAAAVGLAVAVPLLVPAYEPALATVALFLGAVTFQRWVKHPRKLLLLADRTRLADFGAITSLALIGLGILLVTLLCDANLVAYAASTEVAYLGGAVTTLALCHRAVGHGSRSRRFVIGLSASALTLTPLNMAWLAPDPAFGVAAGGVTTVVFGLIGVRVWFPGIISETFDLLLRTRKSTRRRAP